jgi:hypothetical protein
MTASTTVFLLSPANLSGKRGQLLFDPKARFEIAQRLRSPEGSPLGEVFTFVSGLYFRGKKAYAERFGHAPEPPAAYVMTAGGGLSALDEPVDLGRLEGWRRVSVSADNPHFTAPLIRKVCEVSDRLADDARFVLLGSVASPKYVVPLLDALGHRLLFPAQLAGMGDMSRGSLLLRCVAEDRELPYVSVYSLARKGARKSPEE